MRLTGNGRSARTDADRIHLIGMCVHGLVFGIPGCVSTGSFLMGARLARLAPVELVGMQLGIPKNEPVEAQTD